ncbi:MAG: DUF4468 domain-containing protein [Tannerellaceae bacterium]|jgi:hypothetical protein|nr:DUF4468 domain-containing protein [Tannerellaceae bacterium]
MMKRLLLLLLCSSLIPSVLTAQEEDEHYGAGAVSEEGGRVVFMKEITDSSLSQDQLYDKLLDWAERRFNNDTSRVAYSSREKHEFAVTGREKLIFSSTTLSLDTSEMSFFLIVRVTGSTAKIQLTNISYKYLVSFEREPQRLPAEETITDEYALTRKNKLNRINGKFRKGTIDFADKTFGEINTLFAAASPAPQQQAPAPAAAPAAATTEKDGYITFETSKVPESILSMLPGSRMQVLTNIVSALVEINASWKGISEMFGKNVAMIGINESGPVYRQIRDRYILTFTKEGDDVPWIIIECRKQGETSEGENKTLLGEILQIRIK